MSATDAGDRSRAWYERATRVMPGGVNSPARAFRAVGGSPPFISSAEGARLTTVDGGELTDFISSWGALILGHAEPSIVAAVEEAARRGTSFGVPTPQEVELAELVTRLVPSIEVMRMVNSGTEATASAIRVARAATGNPGIIKFEGCYHGHADPFLVKAGSGPATLGEPDSPGVPAATVADTHVARFNDLESVEESFARAGIAAIIVEPVAGNMGVVPPEPGFLEGLRQLCDRHGALLIFDEVMTGFRVACGGAQERYGIEPDLTCLGKVVSGGTPAAVYGGKEDLMRRVAPDGPVYQAGTLAGNPLAVAAGLATFRYLDGNPGIYDELEALGAGLEKELARALEVNRVAGCVQRVGAMLTVFFGPSRVRSWDDAATVDRDRFARFFHAAYRGGVLLPPSPFEALFLMRSHAGIIDDAAAALAAAIGEARVSKPLVRALALEPLARPPVWIMRQAGRYLPEYRKVRESHSFQEVVATPELAAEVTLQPIRRFGMDGAVIFADIMTPLEAMGVEMTFDPGPKLKPLPLREVAELPDLEPDRVAHVADTIRIVASEVPAGTAVIGFSGAPITLLAYLLEGGGSKDFMTMRAALQADPGLAGEALDKLAGSMRTYLGLQVAAGADVVQLFDTWAGLLGRSDYDRFAVPASRDSLSGLDVPTIYFAPGAGHTLRSQPAIGATGYGIDWRTPIDEAFDHFQGRAVQGNLDPAVLHGDPEAITTAVKELLSAADGRPGHIVNLGHGIDRRTPPGHVAAFVEAVRS